jgi:hypothetical protein
MTRLFFTLSISLLLTSNPVRSQSIADLAAQLSLDAQKLSSIKSTLQDMYKGYESLRQGYTRVRDIARDNFNLHQLFLDGLWVLSAAVRNDPRIEVIIETEYHLVAIYQAASSRLAGSTAFTPQELDYILSAFSAVLDRSLQSMQELTMVTTDGQLRMSDDQRLQVITRIDTETRAQLSSLQQFDNSLTVQAAQRQKEANDINTLKSIYGISN